MNKTILYNHKKYTYIVNVSTPYTDRLMICINNVICSYIDWKVFIKNPDKILHKAINRYNIENLLFK